MPRKDPELCSTIRDRVDKWEKYWTINRSLYYEWIDFVMGDQWREDESKLFERYNKIPLMMNKLGVLMNHLLGDQIQNTPNLQIRPDEDVPVETAQVRSALIRNISLNSDAKTVYQTAYGHAIVGGFGAYRIGTKYRHKKSFKQDVIISGFEDPNQCYWDISAKHKCKIDGMYSGFKIRVSRKWFRNKYGKDIESQIGASSITESSTMAFADDDSITMLYDHEKEGKPFILYQLSDGTVVDTDEYKELEKIKIDNKKFLLHNNQPVTIIQKRPEVAYTINERLIAGDFVMEETDFPGIECEMLPEIYVDQRSYYTKESQQITRSFFKDVKDAQRYLNYLATQMAYIIKISRYDQFMGPRKCFASPDLQQMWRDPSVVQGALAYDETPSGDKPTQLQPPELSMSLTQQYERTLMDLQSGTGLYNTQLGEMGNEVAGTAINARNKRGNKNTQIPRNSLDIAIAVGGEVINDMIPKVYDTEDMLVLPMPDSDEQKVNINKPADEYGLQTENDMTQGRYKIRLKPGSSYEEQKEEALESLQLVLNADRSGQVFPMIADLYVENLPLDNNLELRNRLRTLVPPEIIEAGKTGKPLPPKQPQPSPEEIKAQMKMQELQQKEKASQLEYQTKMAEFQIKQSEIQRKAIESHTDMTVQFEKIEADKQKAAVELEKEMMIFKREQEKLEHEMSMATHGMILDHHAKMTGHAVNHHKNQNPPKKEVALERS
jgi:hypothetical protein